MRAARLCGLTLAVSAAHLIAWQIAGAGHRRADLARAGVHWIAITAPGLAAARTPAASPPSPRQSVANAVHRPSPARPRVTPAATAAGVAKAATAPPAAPLRAGAGGALTSVAPEAAAWPLYPTRVPPSLSLHYELEQGGTADLDWQRDSTSFSLRVTTRPNGRPAHEWLSAGAFDGAGVAPVRLAEREHDRDKRAVNFDRESQRVRFSSAPQAWPLAPGVQDRWSWIAQLAAIAEAARAAGQPAIAAGTVWQLQVAGLRGELDRWTFRVLPDATLPGALSTPDNESPAPNAPTQASGLLHVRRDPERPYDLLIDAWLSPELHHLPIGLRMSTPPSAWSLAWRLVRPSAEIPTGP